jgi:glycerophosphoryl diester phosphodiesterase
MKKILHTIAVLAALSAPLNSAEVPKSTDWNVTQHVLRKNFVIQSHRGAGFLAEENTMEAFELGWKLGTVPEADLRTTKDGVIVAFHDENFARVVKGADAALQKKGVKDLTLEELLKLDVGSWKGEQFKGRKVIKMSEVLDALRGKPERNLYMDFKNVDLKQLAQEVKSRGVDKQVILASTKYEIHREWKELVPNSQTLLWMGGEEKKLQERIEELKKYNFEGITQLQIHVRRNKDTKNPNPFTPSNAFLISVGQELRKHKITFQSLPYDMPEPEVYFALMDLGVASFATDYPDITTKAVTDYYTKKGK